MSRANYEKLEIEREGTSVAITFRCSDEYNAMMLYDFLAEQLSSGGINLKVTTRPSPIPHDKVAP
ncbi:hypothetical protein AB8A05_03925 [Tardiphaga sp. 538_B7_N1_4]|uniref:hypothetical protein n=1 Tax=Tardiphaga sp. 538_B7_N1_4 TaxID=3240778 RepID=UPI003F1FED7B